MTVVRSYRTCLKISKSALFLHQARRGDLFLYRTLLWSFFEGEGYPRATNRPPLRVRCIARSLRSTVKSMAKRIRKSPRSSTTRAFWHSSRGITKERRRWRARRWRCKRNSSVPIIPIGPKPWKTSEGRFEEAEVAYRQGVAILSTVFKDNEGIDKQLAEAREVLAGLYIAWGKPDEAQAYQ